MIFIRCLNEIELRVAKRSDNAALIGLPKMLTLQIVLDANCSSVSVVTEGLFFILIAIHSLATLTVRSLLDSGDDIVNTEEHAS